MRMNIKEPRRPRHLVQADIINALGGAETVAAMWLCKPVTVRKSMEDCETGSGQDITVKHFQKLLIAAGEKLSHLDLQNLIDELLGDHFLNLCHRRAYPEEKVFEFVEMLQGKQKAVNE